MDCFIFSKRQQVSFFFVLFSLSICLTSFYLSLSFSLFPLGKDSIFQMSRPVDKFISNDNGKRRMSVFYSFSRLLNTCVFSFVLFYPFLLFLHFHFHEGKNKKSQFRQLLGVVPTSICRLVAYDKPIIHGIIGNAVNVCCWLRRTQEGIKGGVGRPSAVARLAD